VAPPSLSTGAQSRWHSDDTMTAGGLSPYLQRRAAATTCHELPTQSVLTELRTAAQSKLMRSFSTTSGRLWTCVWIEPMYSPSTPTKKS